MFLFKRYIIIAAVGAHSGLGLELQPTPKSEVTFNRQLLQRLKNAIINQSSAPNLSGSDKLRIEWESSTFDCGDRKDISKRFSGAGFSLTDDERDIIATMAVLAAMSQDGGMTWPEEKEPGVVPNQLSDTPNAPLLQKSLGGPTSPREWHNAYGGKSHCRYSGQVVPKNDIKYISRVKVSSVVKKEFQKIIEKFVDNENGGDGESQLIFRIDDLMFRKIDSTEVPDRLIKVLKVDKECDSPACKSLLRRCLSDPQVHFKDHSVLESVPFYYFYKAFVVDQQTSGAHDQFDFEFALQTINFPSLLTNRVYVIRLADFGVSNSPESVIANESGQSLSSQQKQMISKVFKLSRHTPIAMNVLASAESFDVKAAPTQHVEHLEKAIVLLNSDNDRDRECPICSEFMDTLTSSMLTKCGHVFCSHCIGAQNVSSTCDNACPTCKQTDLTTLSINEYFKNAIEEQLQSNNDIANKSIAATSADGGQTWLKVSEHTDWAKVDKVLTPSAVDVKIGLPSNGSTKWVDVIKAMDIFRLVAEGSGSREMNVSQVPQDSQIADEENCSICWGPKVAPVKLSCNHSFCSDCISKWLSQKQLNTKPRCPNCRHAISESELVAIFRAFNQSNAAARRHIRKQVENAYLASSTIRSVQYGDDPEWIRVHESERRTNIIWLRVSKIKTASTGLARGGEIIGDVGFDVGRAGLSGLRAVSKVVSKALWHVLVGVIVLVGGAAALALSPIAIVLYALYQCPCEIAAFVIVIIFFCICCL